MRILECGMKREGKGIKRKKKEGKGMKRQLKANGTFWKFVLGFRICFGFRNSDFGF